MTHHDANHKQSSDDDATQKVTAILRDPWIYALISGVVALGMASLLIQRRKFMAGPIVMLVFASLLFLLCITQAFHFSRPVLTRLQNAAEQTGGQFSLWLAGVGGHTAGPFKSQIGCERFGVLKYREQSVPIEIGQLYTPVNFPLFQVGQRNAHAVIQLPRRLPHMAPDFGRLTKFFGLRIFPVAWHRS